MIPTPTSFDSTTPRSRRFGGFGPVIGAALIVAGLGAWTQRSPSAHGGEPAAQARVAPLTLPAAHGGPVTTSYADLVAKVAPAVVTVRSERMVQQTSLQQSPDEDFLRRFFGQEGNGRSPRLRPTPRRQGGLGSGVVVTADGYILTNNHVVEGASKVRVDFTDGRTFDARVVGTDQPSDLAVLKIAATGLTTVAVGDSDQARVGDVVLAVGNPLGLGQTVTMGIVSAKGRATASGDQNAYEDFIQTDAPINQGNSGGALVSMRGELIGINSQILSPSGGNIGIGFSIPSNMAQDVMRQLIKGGKVQRGMIGVTVQGVTPEVAKSVGLSTVRGAIVTEVRSGGPAERAGVKQGDVILSLDGKSIDSSNSLRNQVARLAPGTSVTLSLQRDGRERDVKVALGEMHIDVTDNESESSPEHAKGKYGLSVEPLTPELARELNLKAGSGVVVSEVDPDGAAADAGLQEGDVIEKVNQQSVTTAVELHSALDAAGKEKPALLLVNRRGAKGFFTLSGRNG
jgi:Do/DeqQ family serine protease